MLFTISTTGSTVKPSFKGLNFETIDISLDQLCDKLSHGHTISSVYDHEGIWKYSGKGILKNHFIGSYSVNIDLDHQPISMEEKLAQIALKPTIAYKTFSDKQGDYRYRFIYVFDSMIYGEKNYEYIYDLICNTNEFDYDSNTRLGYKLMCGTNKEVFLFDNIYNLCDFAPTVDCSECGLCMDCNINGDVPFVNEEFNHDFYTMSYTDLVYKYRCVYRNYEHNIFPKADEDTPIIELPNNWYEITRIWNKVSGKGEVIRLKNHMHRRLNLYRNLIIRRLICPELTFDELIYDLCYEMAFYIDNTDKNDLITKNELVSIAKNALEADPKDFNYKKPRKSIVNYKYMIKYNKTKIEVRNKHNAQKNTENKKKNQEIISRYYNFNLTIKENIEYIEEYTGIRFSDKTIKRWKKDNGLTRNYNKKDNITIEYTEVNNSSNTSNPKGTVMLDCNINGDVPFDNNTSNPKGTLILDCNINGDEPFDNNTSNPKGTVMCDCNINGDEPFDDNDIKDKDMYNKEDLKECVSLSKEEIKKIVESWGINYYDIAIKNSI